MRECATVEKLTRESLEPPPYHHRQPDRAERLQRNTKRESNSLLQVRGKPAAYFLFLQARQTGGGTPHHRGDDLHTAHSSFFPREQCTKCNRLGKCQTRKKPNVKKAHSASTEFVRPQIRLLGGIPKTPAPKRKKRR